jgi:hypothetical protein
MNPPKFLMKAVDTQTAPKHSTNVGTLYELKKDTKEKVGPTPDSCPDAFQEEIRRHLRQGVYDVKDRESNVVCRNRSVKVYIRRGIEPTLVTNQLDVFFEPSDPKEALEGPWKLLAHAHLAFPMLVRLQ